MTSTAIRPPAPSPPVTIRSEEHTSELQSHHDLVCRLLLEKKKSAHRASHSPSRTSDAGGGCMSGQQWPAPPQHVGAWLHIHEDGMVTVLTGKADVGQHTST